VAKRMVELAQWEGNCFGEIESKDINGLRLEMEFRHFSRRIIGKEMFFGHWPNFQRKFTLPQRRLVFYYLARMSRQHLLRNRRIIALRTAELKTGWQSFI
jgi:hypothetical protein